MARTQPKKNLTTVKLREKIPSGWVLRKSYTDTIMENAPSVPKPLEYEDIDRSFYDFVKNELKLIIKGVDIPTFTLYSNQRFSEYSQTWSHTDEENNLLMNFKTVNRENNPRPGENQGGLWNIPGRKWHTYMIRDVMEDNGRESYEFYSMQQPMAVDLTYKVSLVTDIYENINRFNELINKAFSARQAYIRPNGHYLPMLLDDINDNSEYSISDRKFYNQTITIKVMAYILTKDDFKVEKRPKDIKYLLEGDQKFKKPKPLISIDEDYDDVIKHTTIDLTIDFESFHDRVEFDIDTDFDVESYETYNIRSLRISVNDTPIYPEKGFKLKNGDNVYIVIKLVDPQERSQIIFKGIDPSSEYVNGELPMDVKDYVEPVEHFYIFENGE